jgi:hypothetical protein
MPWLLLILRSMLGWLLGPWVERVVVLARADGRMEQGVRTVWLDVSSLPDGYEGRSDDRAGRGIQGRAARWRSAIRWGPAAPPGRDEPPC